MGRGRRKMKHADRVIERFVFLDGRNSPQDREKLPIGETVQ